MSFDDNFLQITVETKGTHQSKASAMASLIETLGQYRQLSITADEKPLEPGSKAGGASWAEIIVSLGAAGALLPTAVNALRDWLVRQPPTTTLKLKRGDAELEYSGANPIPDSIGDAIRAMASADPTRSSGNA